MVLAYRDQIKFIDRLKLIAKAMKGLGLDTALGKALVAALTEGGRSLKALEKDQEPVIAAGIAARKASKEAYTPPSRLGRAACGVSGRVGRPRGQSKTSARATMRGGTD
jgi:hypothetical protein